MPVLLNTSTSEVCSMRIMSPRSAVACDDAVELQCPVGSAIQCDLSCKDVGVLAGWNKTTAPVLHAAKAERRRACVSYAVGFRTLIKGNAGVGGCLRSA